MNNLHKVLGRIGAPTGKLALLCGLDEHALLKIIAGDAPPTPRLLAILELMRATPRSYRERAYARIASEVWRPVPGYDGYEASNLGAIRRKRKFRNMDHYLVVKPNRREDGYLRVTVWRDGKKLHRPVHRLVCLAFHGDPTGEAQLACHDDGDQTNNTEDNLYWGTHAENYADQVRHGTARLLPGVKAKRPLTVAVRKLPSKAKNPQSRQVQRVMPKPATGPMAVKKQNKLKMLERLRRMQNV